MLNLAPNASDNWDLRKCHHWDFWIVKPRQDECMWDNSLTMSVHVFQHTDSCYFCLPHNFLSYIFVKWGVYICTIIFSIFLYFYMSSNFSCHGVCICCEWANNLFYMDLYTFHLNRRQSNHFGALGPHILLSTCSRNISNNRLKPDSMHILLFNTLNKLLLYGPRLYLTVKCWQIASLYSIHLFSFVCLSYILSIPCRRN